MKPSIAVLACHGYLLLVLSITQLALSSKMPDEEPLGAELTEPPTPDSLCTMARIPLPNEMWCQILEKCELTEYVYFLLAYLEIPSPRLSEAVEFVLLTNAFQKLRLVDIVSANLDYECYESIIAVIRKFIKLPPRPPLDEGEAAPGADKEIHKTIIKLAERFSKDCDSQLARQVLFSFLIEDLHGVDIDLDTFKEYQSDILYAAALTGNYDQLEALVGKFKLEWDDTVKVVAPAIAKSGSVELFEKVLQVSSFQAFLGFSVWIQIIKFNKKELFLKFLLQLNCDRSQSALRCLGRIGWDCCRYERQELIRILIEHQPNPALIGWMECLSQAIRIGNMDIFTMLLGDPARPDLRVASLFNSYAPLDAARDNGRVDMLRFMLSLDGLCESSILRVFSNAVQDGQIEIMELLLQAGPDGHTFMTDCLFATNDEILEKIGKSGCVDVLEFFLRKRDEKDARFCGFSVGINDNVILCSACNRGQYDLVKYLLRRNEDTRAFIFPDVDPAAQANGPLCNGVLSLLIMTELLRQDPEGGMVYRDVAVTNRVLLRAAAFPYCENFEFLLQTVKHEDGSIRFKFPIIDINFDNHELLEYLIRHNKSDKLEFLLRRDPDSGDFLLPGIQVPERLVEGLDALGVLWRT